VNIDLESTYQKNNIGKTIYETVLKYRPNIVIDFGVLYGYSTICIAKALQVNGFGKIYAYDLWDKYPYKHTTIDIARKNLEKYDVSSLVTLEQEDFFKWIENPTPFDLLHIDISNDGDKIEYAYNKLKKNIESGSVVIFEGGTIERDQEEWVAKYEKTPIYPLKDKLNYEIINYNWPGLSLIQKDNI
jgi:predicted O-methyltransferase YrrM